MLIFKSIDFMPFDRSSPFSVVTIGHAGFLADPGGVEEQLGWKGGYSGLGDIHKPALTFLQKPSNSELNMSSLRERKKPPLLTCRVFDCLDLVRGWR